MSEQPEEIIQPWYRQFWFWFVFGPLIFIIIMCGFTVSIALNNSDDVIIDNYYKEGRMINQTLDQDKHAKALGLVADLRVDRVTGDVMLSFPKVPDDATAIPEQLLLLMGHPVKAAKDQQVLLTRIAPGQYRGSLAVKPEYSWYLTLYSVPDLAQRREAAWSLSGEINFADRDTAELRPRVH